MVNDFAMFFGDAAQQKSMIKRGLIFKNFKAKQKALKKHGVKIMQVGDYCSNLGTQCGDCSLSNYGRDCHNNIIGKI